MLTWVIALLCGNVPVPLRLLICQSQLAAISTTDLHQTWVFHYTKSKLGWPGADSTSRLDECSHYRHDCLPSLVLGLGFIRSSLPMWPCKVKESPLRISERHTNKSRGAYDLTVANPKCYSQYKLFQITLYQAVLIFVCDVIILIAPLVILCGLQMPTRKIIALMAIFGSGSHTPRYIWAGKC